MTPRSVFQAFLLSLAGLSTVASAQNRDAATPGRNTSSAAYFSNSGRNAAAETVESPELFPADRAATARPADSRWSQTRTQSRLVRQVAGQPAAPGVPGEDPKIPPAPVGGGPDPKMPLSKMTTPHGPSGYSAPLGAPMTSVDQVFPEGGASCGNGCATECCSDWCRKCWWFGTHTTGDMPQHFPYPPEFGGYYYFLPYNYSHIFDHRKLAPLVGADTIAPYEVNLQKIYVEALGEEEANRSAGDGVLKPLTPDSGKLPILEELLANKHDLDNPRGRPGKTAPPKPGIDDKPDSPAKAKTDVKPPAPPTKAKADSKVDPKAKPKTKGPFDE